MIVVCLEGCHGTAPYPAQSGPGWPLMAPWACAGSGKTELCTRFRDAGYMVLDEAFLDMPEYALHPQSLLMETTWVCTWCVAAERDGGRRDALQTLTGPGASPRFSRLLKKAQEMKMIAGEQVRGGFSRPRARRSAEF